MKKSELRRRIDQLEEELYDVVDFLTYKVADSVVFQAFFDAGFHLWLDEEPVGGDTPPMPKTTSSEQGGKVRVGAFGPMYLLSFEFMVDEQESTNCHLALPDLDSAPDLLERVVRPFRIVHDEDEFVRHAMTMLASVSGERLRDLVDVSIARKVLES